MSEKSKKKSYTKVIIGFWITVLSGILLISLFIAAIATEHFGDLPDLVELENPKSNIASEIYSADQQLLGKYYIQNRSPIHYEDLSMNVVNALLATEDIRFEEHAGIDPRGLLRVIVRTIILGQRTGGGSTITQQLAKNLFPRIERPRNFEIIVIKIKEWITAVKLEKNYSKKRNSRHVS